METKICSKCFKELDINNFSCRKSGIRRNNCKECARVYSRKHYSKNVKYYREKTKKRIQDNREKIYTYLLSHPCIDCGEKDVVVLEFDHESDKKDSISSMKRYGSWENIKKEISKCDVRCANCHRRKTAKQFNTWKYKMSVKN